MSVDRVRLVELADRAVARPWEDLGPQDELAAIAELAARPSALALPHEVHARDDVREQLRVVALMGMLVGFELAQERRPRIWQCIVNDWTTFIVVSGSEIEARMLAIEMYRLGGTQDAPVTVTSAEITPAPGVSAVVHEWMR